MRRLVSVVGVSLAVVLFILIGIGVAMAQTPEVTYQTGIQIYNLSSVEASIVATFYNSDGSIAASPGYTVTANSSITLWPLPAPDGFIGSVVIYSSGPLVSIANQHGYGAGYEIAASFEGASEGSQQVNLPLIMRYNGGVHPLSTWLSVQNTGTADAEVRIDYYPLPGKGNPDTEFATIKPGAAAVFDQRDNSDLGSLFVGSAVISSTNGVPLAAVVNQESTTDNWQVLMSYLGLKQGAPTIALPLIMSNNGFMSLWTGLQIQNVGTQPTTITISYSGNVAGVWNPAGPDVQQNVGPGESMNLNNDTLWSSGNRYVGSATATSSNGQALQAIVNQHGNPHTAWQGATYTGVDPNMATSKVVAPLIMSCNNTCDKLWTGFQVMNVDATRSTTVTVSFVPGPGYAGKTDEVAVNVGPGDSANFMQGEGDTANWDGSRWIGSAVITASDDVPIAVLVNSHWRNMPAGGGDHFLTYGAFNVEP